MCWFFFNDLLLITESSERLVFNLRSMRIILLVETVLSILQIEPSALRPVFNFCASLYFADRILGKISRGFFFIGGAIYYYHSSSFPSDVWDIGHAFTTFIPRFNVYRQINCISCGRERETKGVLFTDHVKQKESVSRSPVLLFSRWSAQRQSE